MKRPRSVSARVRKAARRRLSRFTNEGRGQAFSAVREVEGVREARGPQEVRWVEEVGFELDLPSLQFNHEVFEVPARTD